MSDEVVAQEVAEREFARFLDAMDLTEKVSTKTLDADDRKAFDANKVVVLLAMRRGALVIDEQGQPIFTPVKGVDQKPIVFKEPTGATIKALDQAKKDNGGERTIILLGAITGEVQARFVKMVRRDLAVCESLALLFFA